MTQEMLAIIWFIILAIAWAVYLALESFVVGSGMLIGFLSKGSKKTEIAIQTSSGLHWDGIEVWLITAVGGTFAAFPLAFATTLESMYIAFYLLVAALIVRGATIELMYKDSNPAYQKWMRKGWQISSLLVPLIIGVYIANIFMGVKIDETGYIGSFISLFTMPALLNGILFVAIALTTGAYWIVLTTKEGAHHDKAKSIGFKTSIVSAVLVLVMMMAFNTGSGTFTGSQLLGGLTVLWAVPGLTVLVAILTVVFSLRKRSGWAFLCAMLTQVLFAATGFMAIFPYMLPSKLRREFGISIMDAASSQHTLQLMFIVALIFVPIVIAYQGWKFYFFAKTKE